MSKGKRKKHSVISILFPARLSENQTSPSRNVKHRSDRPKKQKPATTEFTTIIASGIRWMLGLTFVILLLVAIEAISVVVFGRQPSQTYTPVLISALTTIVGGILFFFRILVRHYRNSHTDDE